MSLNPCYSGIWLLIDTYNKLRDKASDLFIEQRKASNEFAIFFHNIFLNLKDLIEDNLKNVNYDK